MVFSSQIVEKESSSPIESSDNTFGSGDSALSTPSDSDSPCNDLSFQPHYANKQTNNSTLRVSSSTSTSTSNIDVVGRQPCESVVRENQSTPRNLERYVPLCRNSSTDSNTLSDSTGVGHRSSDRSFSGSGSSAGKAVEDASPRLQTSSVQTNDPCTPQSLGGADLLVMIQQTLNPFWWKLCTGNAAPFPFPPGSESLRKSFSQNTSLTDCNGHYCPSHCRFMPESLPCKG